MPRNSQTRVGTLVLLFMAATVAGLLDGSSASAEQNRRVPRRTSIPVPRSRAAPDVTGTVKGAKPADTTPVTPVLKNDDDEGPLKPFDLPAAPRARMRECGENWQKIKMSGEAGDRTWREFATVCLTERVTPSSPRNVISNATR